MDLEQFKNFLKQKCIIINYPSGGLGGFLANTLYNCEDILTPDSAGIFNEVGAFHHSIIKSFKNFHSIDDLNNWINLSYDEKLNYLFQNCLLDFSNIKKFVILLLCCPNYGYELTDFFDEDKIITIKPNSNSYDILESLILNKVLHDDISINFLKKTKLSKYKINILNEYKQQLFQILSKKIAIYFIEEVSYNQKHVYNFESFFDKKTFVKMLNQIEIQLNIILDYNSIDKLYNNFRKANAKYIEPYLATKAHV